MPLRIEPCPYCDVEINVLAVFDPERGPNQGEQACPECHTTRRAIEALVDGDIEREDIVDRGQYQDISAQRMQELKESRDEYDDPAEENQYRKEQLEKRDPAEVEA